MRSRSGHCERRVREWAIRQGWGGRPVRQGAGPGDPDRGAWGTGGALRVRGDQASLLKGAHADSDDRFRIEEQKSAVATATAGRDPQLTFTASQHWGGCFKSSRGINPHGRSRLAGTPSRCRRSSAPSSASRQRSTARRARSLPPRSCPLIILAMLVQRHLVRGLTLGAVHG
jgi:hypothetical protein